MTRTHVDEVAGFADSLDVAVVGDAQYVVVVVVAIASVASDDDDWVVLGALSVWYSVVETLGLVSAGLLVEEADVDAASADLLRAVDLAGGVQIALDNNYYNP